MSSLSFLSRGIGTAPWGHWLWLGYRVGIVVVIALLTVVGAVPPAATAQPAQPKRLVAVLEEDPPVINPGITTVISSYATGTPIYNALITIHRDYTMEGELAEKWEVSPDAKTYTFHLRKGVTWHDGKPFTSADVKFSIENANSKLQPYGKQVYAQVDRIDTPDDYTVIIRLKQVFAPFLFGMYHSPSMILPKHVFEGSDLTKNPANQAPIGTGPFKFKEWVKGDHITLVKNDKYFRPGKPKIDELVFKIIPDQATRVAAFEKGEVDVIYHNALPLAEARRLAALPGVESVLADNRGGAFLGIMNVRDKPLSDVRVRRAIAHGIDRAFIQKNVNDGFGIPMLGPVPPASNLYNKNLKDYEFSPAKATALLDEAGYPKGADGTRFAFDYVFPSTDQGMAKIGDVMKTNLAAVGIKVNLVPLERAAMNQKAYIDLQFGMLNDSYGLGPDPAIGTARLYVCSNIVRQPFTNSSGYCNPEVDKLFQQETLQTDPAKRKEIYDKIQEMIWNDVPILPFFSIVPPNLYRASYVKGPLFAPAHGNQEPFEDAEIIGVPGQIGVAAPKPAAAPTSAAAAPAEKPAVAPAATQAPAPAPATAPATGGTSAIVYVVGAAVVIGVAAGGFLLLRRR